MASKITSKKKPIKAIKKVASRSKAHKGKEQKSLGNNDKKEKRDYPEARAVRNFYPTDLSKCRTSLTALLNRLNYMLSDGEVKRIRAQTLILRTISEILLQEKELEIEARIAELEQELKAKAFQMNSK